MNLEIPIPSFLRLDKFGLLKATGADAAVFLHRMSTNNIQALETNQSCLTTFLNEKGRLVAATYVKKTEPHGFLLFTPYDCHDTLAKWLDTYLFSEDVTIINARDSTIAYCALTNETQPHDTIKGPSFRIDKKNSVSSFFHLAEPDDEGSLRAAFIHNALLEISEPDFDNLKIVAGVPFSSNEINLQHNPIQLGLLDSIHWAKGCYIGQEVISRLESKDRTKTSLYRVCTSEQNFSKLQQGESVLHANQPLGILTSVATHYLKGQAQGLVILKNPVSGRSVLTKNSQVSLDIMEQGE